MRNLSLIFLAFLLALAFTGCDFSETTTPTDPIACGDGVCNAPQESSASCPTDCPPPADSVFSIAGFCRVSGAASVVCEDESEGETGAVRFEILSQTSGVSIEIRNTTAGGTQTFSGLAPDTYQVEHVVQPAGTGDPQEDVYSNLEVSG